jgi:D-psicose/D-tagatose/L-ribulose 3-epimerase
MGFKYAITLASFKDTEPLEQTLERISGLGYDAVEMYGEPEKVDVGRLIELFGSYDVAVCGITGMWGSASQNGQKRQLLNLDGDVQKQAGEYVKKCVRMCRLLGGGHLNVCLFADDNLSFFEKTHRTISVQRKKGMQELAVPVLSELAGFAAEHDVKLFLEPLNRYSTQFCSTADDALAIVEKVDSDYLGVMLDTFHMNIEEDSFENTISRVANRLGHMHFADNNRKMPGYGHIDFNEIVGALVRAGYNGYATFEPTIYNASNSDVPLKNGLQYVKSIEAGMRPSKVLPG